MMRRHLSRRITIQIASHFKFHAWRCAEAGKPAGSFDGWAVRKRKKGYDNAPNPEPHRQSVRARRAVHRARRAGSGDRVLQLDFGLRTAAAAQDWLTTQGDMKG